MQFTIIQHTGGDMPPDIIKSMDEWEYVYGRPEVWLIARAMVITSIGGPELWTWTAYSGLKILSKEQIHSPYDIMPGVKLGYCGPVFVKPEFRGHGLQKRLLSFKERIAHEMGIHVLTAAVDYDNIPSVNNIIKCGFY